MDSGIGNDVQAVTRSSRRRRLTVTDKCSDLVAELRGTVSQLQSLWDQVDMSEDLRVSRLKNAFDLISNLQSEMIESERAMVRGVHANIKEGMEKIALLRSRMNMAAWPWNIGTTTKDGSLELRSMVEQEVERLNQEYKERRKDQKEVFEKLDRVAFRVGVDINGLIPETKELLPQSELGVLVARANELSHTLNERIGQAQNWQKHVRELLQKMGISSLGNEVAEVMLSSDVSDEDFVLSPAIMETFEKDVVEVADKKYKDWISQLEFAYDEKMITLQDLWIKCCVPAEAQHFESEFDPEKHTQADIDEMARECKKLDGFYRARKEVYAAFSHWSDLWAEKTGYEEISQKDAYTNRGCELERRLKRIRDLENRLLPSAIRAVEEAQKKHLQACPGDKVEINESMDPIQYIEWVKKTHAEEKALEKLMKKTKQQEQAQSPAFRTPKRTPVRGAAGRLLAAPASASRLLGSQRPMGQLDTTSLSVINPRFPNSPGPKTSSPKGKTAKRRVANGPTAAACSTPSKMRKAFSTVSMSPMRPSNRRV